jgi:hypothetical protein
VKTAPPRMCFDLTFECLNCRAMRFYTLMIYLSPRSLPMHFPTLYALWDRQGVDQENRGTTYVSIIQFPAPKCSTFVSPAGHPYCDENLCRCTEWCYWSLSHVANGFRSFSPHVRRLGIYSRHRWLRSFSMLIVPSLYRTSGPIE